MITFLAPAFKWRPAFSAAVYRPVDSITYSTPSPRQGRRSGVLVAATHLIPCPSTIRMSSCSAEELSLAVEMVLEIDRGRNHTSTDRQNILRRYSHPPQPQRRIPVNKTLLRHRGQNESPDSPNPLIATFAAILTSLGYVFQSFERQRFISNRGGPAPSRIATVLKLNSDSMGVRIRQQDRDHTSFKRPIRHSTRESLPRVRISRH